MGSVVVDVRLRAEREVLVKALVDTGFYGDVITRPEIAERVGVDARFRRIRRLPDGRVVSVAYGFGEVELLNEVTSADIEVWDGLRLPEGIDALLGVTVLGKFGLRVNPRSGTLERVELYLV